MGISKGPNLVLVAVLFFFMVMGALFISVLFLFGAWGVFFLTLGLIALPIVLFAVFGELIIGALLVYVIYSSGKKP